MKLHTAVICALLMGAPWALAQDPCAQPQVAQLAAQARSLVQQKKFAEAESPARQALGSCSTHPEGVATLGESLVGQKRFDDAITAMTTVIQTKPDVPHAYLWRGFAYYSKKQQLAKAVVDLEEFLRLAPNAPEAPTARHLLTAIKR